uniref:Dynein axonemal intermediate chain 7 n=1 Tax=Pseudonaja textilis TaxID=8673 RepID=A0A670XSQ5_PSETE
CAYARQKPGRQTGKATKARQHGFACHFGQACHRFKIMGLEYYSHWTRESSRETLYLPLFPIRPTLLCFPSVSISALVFLQWEHYTCCDGSPDPTVPQEINTFMSLWLEESENDITTVVEKGSKVLELIAKLEMYVLETPFDELPSSDVIQYQETIVHLQKLLHHKYNQATEHLLKQASSYGESESGNMELVMKEKDITLCLWANLKKNARFRSQLFHDENQQPCHGFDLPKPLTTCDVAVRILHTRYDHLSSFQAFPKEFPKLDLPSTEGVAQPSEDTDVQNEETLKDVSEIKTETSVRTMVRRGRNLQKKKENRMEWSGVEWKLQRSSDLPSLCPFPAHVSALRLFDISELDILEDYTVDLHQFMTVGGVYYCDLLKLPPQAKLVKGWTIVEVLDTGLETYPYTASCEESEDNSAVTVGITIHLSDSVVYFEEPLIARWDNQGTKHWRTDDIGEVIYNMKEKEISFRMNGFFTVTFLQDAHLNMPYQAWELQPVGPDKAIFTILTTFAEVQIHIKVRGRQPRDLGSGLGLKHLSNREKWMTPMSLLIALKKAGMNLFPAEYSTKYVSVNKKTLLAEVMVYQQMSLVATSFAFGWSKWNLKSGENDLVFKVEQILEEEWELYMFNGQRAQKLAIDEDSNAFSKNIAEGSEFHSTLYHLLKDTGSKEAMDRVRQSNYLFIDAVYQMLLATRVLTYS